jgi:hypothetical protein
MPSRIPNERRNALKETFCAPQLFMNWCPKMRRDDQLSLKRWRRRARSLSLAFTRKVVPLSL